MIRSPWVRQPLAALLLGLTLGGCHRLRSAAPASTECRLETRRPTDISCLRSDLVFRSWQISL